MRADIAVSTRWTVEPTTEIVEAVREVADKSAALEAALPNVGVYLGAE